MSSADREDVEVRCRVDGDEEWIPLSELEEHFADRAESDVKRGLSRALQSRNLR